MKVILYILISALCSISLFAQNPSAGTLDLRQSTNLKTLFDGGLRPTQVQGLENTKCEIGSSDLTVILPKATPFDFEVQMGDFSVLAGNQLAEINLYGVYTSVPEAVSVTQAICKAIGFSDEGLDRAVANMGTTPAPNKFWTQYGNPAGLRTQVTFYPMYYYDHVAAQVNLFITCGNYPNGMKFLTEPIQAPQGYEGVSMTPAPLKPGGTPFPGVETQKVVEKLDSMRVQSASPLEQNKLVQRSRSWLWLWISGIIVILIGIFSWFKLRRDQKL